MRYKSGLIILALTSILSSCGGKAPFSNTAHLVDVTAPMMLSDKKTEEVKIPGTKMAKDWHSAINFVNDSIDNYVSEHDLTHVKPLTIKGAKSFSFYSAPILAKDNLYFIDSNHNIYSVDNKTKQLNWKVLDYSSSILKGLSGATITYSDDMLFVTLGSRDILVLNANNGHEILRKSLSDIVRSPIAYKKGLLFAKTVGNNIYAIDVKTGRQVWAHGGMPEVIFSGAETSPVVTGKYLIATLNAGELMLIDIEKGEKLWEIDFSSELDIIPGMAPANVSSQPVLRGKHLVLSTNTNYLYKIDIEKSEIMWQKSIEDIQNINVIGNYIYLTTSGKELAAVELSSGEIKWITSLRESNVKDAVKPDIYFAPVMVNGKLSLVSLGGQALIINPRNGNIEHRTVISTKPIRSFIVANGFFEVFTENGSILSAIDVAK